MASTVIRSGRGTMPRTSKKERQPSNCSSVSLAWSVMRGFSRTIAGALGSAGWTMAEARRAVPLPEQLVVIFRLHKEEQDPERALARDLWADKGYVFTSGTGAPLNPSTDYHRWKRLLREASIRDSRLHDARHTASTVLLLLGVPEQIVTAIMGWSSTSMAQRYQHVTEPMLNDVSRKIGAALWGDGEPTGPTDSS
ncbi:tyrosine-type recombinase/integrase [Kitasatospora sp. NPDC005748]|uniref:tyrosine-type recombinase/integrase n=1 Tax=Kitasatospora sp. NPDC005748 TaxID=3157063 RepID=UPI003401ABD0